MAVSLYKVVLRKQGAKRKAKAKVNLAKATDRKINIKGKQHINIK